MCSSDLSKIDAERAILDAGNSTSLRLATVFGVSPRLRIDLLVNDFVFQAARNRFVVVFEGHFKRNYIHVTDVVRAFIHGIDNFESMRGQIYNVGLSEANISKAELCSWIKKHIPEFVVMEAALALYPDQRNYIVSNAKIESKGFNPKVNLESGIDELSKFLKMFDQRSHSNI